MAIPVGGGFALQHLVLVDKAPDGTVRTRQTLPVTFVPLVRGAQRSRPIGEILAEIRRRKLNGELDGRDAELAAARDLVAESAPA